MGTVDASVGGEEIAMARKALEERIFVGNKLTEMALVGVDLIAS